MLLPKYLNNSEKQNSYAGCFCINNEKEFDDIFSKIKEKEHDFLFRGINCASYKMFSSVQRYWLTNDKGDSLTVFYNFIESLINVTSDVPEVKNYMHNENIEYNEFFILAMMQHFGLPSPLVDFSRSMEKALFFAVDKALDNWNDDGSDSLDNYVSLYLLPNNIDWVQASLQTLMEHAAERVDQMISDWRINNPNCKLDTKDFEFDVRNASFSQFRCGKYSDITFLPVNGPAGGRVNLSIPSLNFTCDYYIINDRLLSQQGTFITNFTMDQPLVELMNEKCRNKFFTCINIRKNLIQYIKDKCLDPSGINKESLYFPDDEAKLLSSTLEKIEY